MADAAHAELERRWVTYALLRVAARVGWLVGMRRGDFVELAEMALFHEGSDRGATQRGIADRLDVSVRKVAQMSRRLKTRLAEVSGGLDLERRILFTLWPGPLSEAKLCQAMRDVDGDEVRDALKTMLANGEVVEQVDRTTTYAVARHATRRVAGNWFARFDGLNHLGSCVANAVAGRFFRGEERAFARNSALRARREDIGRLQSLYADTIWPTLVEIDEAARGHDDAEALDFSVVWAPSVPPPDLSEE